MTEPTSTTLLLDLINQMGNMRADLATLMSGLGHVGEKQKEVAEHVAQIESRLVDGSKRHTEFAATLADIELKLDPTVIAVTELKPQVKELMDWKTQVAAIMVASSAIVGTAAWFAWEGLKWFFPSAKDLIFKIFH